MRFQVTTIGLLLAVFTAACSGGSGSPDTGKEEIVDNGGSDPGTAPKDAVDLQAKDDAKDAEWGWDIPGFDGQEAYVCMFCASQKCETEFDKCKANLQCWQIVLCVSAQWCDNKDTCYEDCMAMYPGGKTDFMNLGDCMDKNCATECAD